MRLILDNIALNESRAECHDLDWEDPVKTDLASHPQGATNAGVTSAFSSCNPSWNTSKGSRAVPCRLNRPVPQAVPRELLGCNLVVAADVVYNETVVPILVVSAAALTRIMRPRSDSLDGRRRVLGRVAAARAFIRGCLSGQARATRTDLTGSCMLQRTMHSLCTLEDAIVLLHIELRC